MAYTTLVTADVLRDQLSNPGWVVLDVRHDLSNPSAGEAAYGDGHVPGAHFLHLDRDLSGPKTGINGRHPLPLPQDFAAMLSKLGVGPSTQVVVYDAQGSMFAARVWWMLRWIGHESVCVLDGGFPAWIAAGGAVDRSAPSAPVAGGLAAGSPLVVRVEVDQILSNLQDRQKLVVDARSPDRWRGENETLDPVGGRIPGSVNRFFKDNLEASGAFKSPDKLRQEFKELLGAFPSAKVVAQCGSGVTACHNLLAMEVAGLSGASLYAGSWSEWCSDPSRPFEVG